MFTTRKAALVLAALTLSLAGAPAALAQGYPQTQVDIQVNVQVDQVPQPEPVYQPPVARQDVHESRWERTTTTTYADPADTEGE